MDQFFIKDIMWLIQKIIYITNINTASEIYKIQISLKE